MTLSVLARAAIIQLNVVMGQVLNQYADQERVKENIDKILSSKEFSEPVHNRSFQEALVDMVYRFLNWAIEKFLEFYNRFSRGGIPTGGFKTANGNFLIVWIVCGLIIALFIIWIMRYLHKKLYMSGKIKDKAFAELLLALTEPEEARKRAADHAAAGRYTLALRDLYIALLLTLNQKSWIRIDKSKTNEDYMHELSIKHLVHLKEVLGFTGVFNQSRYGSSVVDSKTFAHWEALFSAMISETYDINDKEKDTDTDSDTDTDANTDTDSDTDTNTDTNTDTDTDVNTNTNTDTDTMDNDKEQNEKTLDQNT